MELDETDPAVWSKLESATDDYMHNTSAVFKDLIERLLASPHDEKLLDSSKSQHIHKEKNLKGGTIRWILI